MPLSKLPGYFDIFCLTDRRFHEDHQQNFKCVSKEKQRGAIVEFSGGQRQAFSGEFTEQRCQSIFCPEYSWTEGDSCGSHFSEF